MAELKGCGSCRHCVTWGFCHRCQPELSAKVIKAWYGTVVGAEGPYEAYERLVAEILTESQALVGE